MTADSVSFDGDADLVRVIDQACDRFVAAWKSDSVPSIEGVLAETPAAAHGLLLQELLHLELDIRSERGETPVKDDYLGRFPYAVEAVERAFGLVTTFPRSLASTTAMRDTPKSAVLKTTSPTASPPDAPPDAPPDYEIERELGRGGMGVVYLARQRSANRLVALKVIRPECLEGGDAHVRARSAARFRREALAAARLQHDHLVTVFDVGEWQGRPYYAMRYVAGRSLMERLREGPLTGQEAAALLAPVARAVHAAHEAGILHRDLKPHNILLEDGTQRPLVADFGLAKLLDGDTQVTRTGEVFGSPPYMSPEQAVDASRTTEASDIYGLGAVLYHVLAGRPPFQAASIPETLRQVLQSEPVAPRHLNSAVHRDLETICLKCLDKEPARRYASAAALADDIERFLEDRPITARPVASLEKAWRWSRRNRWVACLLVALLVSLTGGLLGITVQWRRASLNLEVAQNRLRIGRDVIRELLVQVGKEELRDVPEMEPVREALLKKALGYYELLLEEAAEDPQLMRDLAVAQIQVGNIYAWLGRYDEAEATLNEAKSHVKLLLARNPGDQALWKDLATAHSELGVMLFHRGRLEDAERELLAGMKVTNRLAPTDSGKQLDLATNQNNLAALYRAKGDLSKAVASYEESRGLLRELNESQPEDAGVLFISTSVNYNLSLTLRELGRIDDAEAASKEALASLESWESLEPHSTHRRRLQAQVFQSLGWLRNAASQPQEAVQYLQQAADLTEKLRREHPDLPRYEFELARILNSLSFTQNLLGDREASRSSLDRAIQFLESLQARAPGVAEYHGELGEAYVSRGWQLQSAGKVEEARNVYGQAIRSLATAERASPGNRRYLQMLGQANHELGILLREINPIESRQAYETAYRQRKQLVEQTTSPKFLDDLGHTCNNLGWVLFRLGHADSATDFAMQAVAARKQAAKKWPSLQHSFNLANSLMEAARLHLNCGRASEAKSLMEQAVGAGERLLSDNPGVESLRMPYANWVATYSEYIQLDDADEALAALRYGMEVLTSAASDDVEAPPPDNAVARLMQLMAYVQSARLGQHDEAAMQIKQAWEHATPGLQFLLNLTKLEIAARRGDYQAAVADAEALDMDATPLGPRSLLSLARVYAIAAQRVDGDTRLAADVRQQLRSTYSSKATGYLQQAAAEDEPLAQLSLTRDPELHDLGALLEARATK
ncbi:MAG: protein kinase [Pirellulales bacterium]